MTKKAHVGLEAVRERRAVSRDERGWNSEVRLESEIQGGQLMENHARCPGSGRTQRNW